MEISSIGIFVMLVLLELNDIVLDCTDEELVHLGLGVAGIRINLRRYFRFCKKSLIQKASDY